MRPDTKAIRAELADAYRPRETPLIGPALRCLSHVEPLCDRVEALERALANLLDDEKNQTNATWEAARAALEGEP